MCITDSKYTGHLHCRCIIKLRVSCLAHCLPAGHCFNGFHDHVCGQECHQIRRTESFGTSYKGSTLQVTARLSSYNVLYIRYDYNSPEIDHLSPAGPQRSAHTRQGGMYALQGMCCYLSASACAMLTHSQLFNLSRDVFTTTHRLKTQNFVICSPFGHDFASSWYQQP